MHDCVSGLVSQHTEVSFCPNQCVKDSKEEREQRDILLLSMHVLVCVHYNPLLFIVSLHHSKQSCST